MKISFSEDIQRFYRILGIKDVHATVNNTQYPLDFIHTNGSKIIDSIAMTVNLLDFAEGSILIETNEIIPSDYRGYIVDVNLEDYFDKTLTIINKINHQILNPSRKSHKEKFKEE